MIPVATRGRLREIVSKSIYGKHGQGDAQRGKENRKSSLNVLTTPEARSQSRAFTWPKKKASRTRPERPCLA